MARFIYDLAVTRKDPHAIQLATAPYAGTLLAAYAENCAPVSGFSRHHYDAEEDEDRDVGDGGADDILRLLAVLAPEVCIFADRTLPRLEQVRTIFSGYST